MDHHGRSSIRRSLVRSILLTTGIALVISSATSVVLEVVRYRDAAEASLVTLGRVVGSYSRAALDFDDRRAGRESLAALADEPDVEAAALYDAQGRRFAHYRREAGGSGLPDRVASPGMHREGDRLRYVAPIGDPEHPSGWVYVERELPGLVEAMWTTLATVAGVMGIALLVASIVASRLREQIATPLEELARSAAAMQGGDLTVGARLERDDEFGVLAESFDRTREALGSLVAQVRENALAMSEDARVLLRESEALRAQARRQDEVVSATASSAERVGASAREVRDTVENLASTTTETSSSVIELEATARRIDEHMDALFVTVDAAASSISEMSAAVRQIASNADAVGGATQATDRSLQVLRQSVKKVEANAKKCQDLSTRASENAEHGSEVVGEAVEGMGRIDASFQGLASIVGELATRSEAIDGVIKVIEAVVAETNLLALNASIISSHAGEHGRAFAVVAQEVKNLAQRTAGSTREIAEAMESVRSGIDDAVGAVGDGVEIVKHGVALSQEAGRALERIRQSSDESSRMVTDIVRATEEQSADIDTVDAAMRSLHGGVDQITVGTHEQEKVASELLDGVEQMRQLARDVKLATSEQSRQSGHMSQAVESVATSVNQILASAEAQHDDVAAIVRAIEVFSENTSASARQAEALRECVESLSERSAKLEAGVRRFTV